MRSKRVVQTLFGTVVLVLFFVVLFVWLLDRVVATWSQSYAYPMLAQLDVGQGDSILLRSSTGSTVLIDGGPDRSVLYALGRVLPFFDRSIDMILLTHPDADHVTGLAEVLQVYDVGLILTTGIPDTLPAYQAFWEIVHQQQIPVQTAVAGQTYIVDEITLHILWPPVTVLGDKTIPSNDTSIVAQVEIDGATALLTGDATKSVEEQLLQQYTPVELHSDILKIGHHGSRSSSSYAFVRTVAPKFATIGVGVDNWYGHPHPQVLTVLSLLNVHIDRTDEVGTIIWYACGHNWQSFLCDI